MVKEVITQELAAKVTQVVHQEDKADQELYVWYHHNNHLLFSAFNRFNRISLTFYKIFQRD